MGVEKTIGGASLRQLIALFVFSHEWRLDRGLCSGTIHPPQLCQPADPVSPRLSVLADHSPCSNVGLYPLDLPTPVEPDGP